jgi:peptidoglycan/xylan/chitin deacetylase (PgdA/CDA1 family)
MDNKFSYVYPKNKNDPMLKKKKKSVTENTIKNSDSGKTAYITLDDGPSAHTPQILDTLKRYGIKATFFVIGQDTTFGRSMYKRIVDEGHQLGNHSYSHNYSSIYKSVQSFLDDFLRLENLLQSSAGISTRLIRYPGGSNNTVSHHAGGPGIMRQIIAELSRRGYTHCDWNVDAGDATSAINNPNLIIRNVLEQSVGKSNAVVLLHDADYQKHTPTVLPQIIEGLRSQGFNFSVLSKTSFLVQFDNPP